MMPVSFWNIIFSQRDALSPNTGGTCNAHIEPNNANVILCEGRWHAGAALKRHNQRALKAFQRSS